MDAEQDPPRGVYGSRRERRAATVDSEPARPQTRRELRAAREAATHETTARPAAVPPAKRARNRPPEITPDPMPPGEALFGSLAGRFAPAAMLTSAQPTVLIVCTGNICRSPLAEALLRARLIGLDLRVHSAGTHGMVGHAMTDTAQRLALDRGADPAVTAAHRARLLTELLLDDADLILTMTAEQREHAMHLQPRRRHRTFSVREFARLAGGLADAQVRAVADGHGTDRRSRLIAVAESIASRRGGHTPADEDVIDPYRRSSAVYEESAAQLTPALLEAERVIRAALVR